MSMFLKGQARLGLLVLAVTIGLMGCSSGRYVIIDPPSVPLKNFDVLEIKDCTSNQQEEHALNLAKVFSDNMAKKIENYNKSHQKATLFKTVTRSTDQTDRVLVMQPVLQSYEKGSGVARYMIGFGAGKASCCIQCTFSEKTSGQQVLRANFEGELSMGVLGGSAKEAAGKVYDKIIEYLRKNY